MIFIVGTIINQITTRFKKLNPHSHLYRQTSSGIIVVEIISFHLKSAVNSLMLLHSQRIDHHNIYTHILIKIKLTPVQTPSGNPKPRNYFICCRIYIAENMWSTFLICVVQARTVTGGRPHVCH